MQAFFQPAAEDSLRVAKRVVRCGFWYLCAVIFVSDHDPRPYLKFGTSVTSWPLRRGQLQPRGQIASDYLSQAFPSRCGDLESGSASLAISAS